jgi:DNA-binding transcriptional ArsR family regulator
MGRPRIHFAAATELLEANGEMRACDIAEKLGITPSILASAMRVPERDGEIFRRKEGRHALYRLTEELPAANDESSGEKPKFNAALWADGDLVLVGVEMNTDGNSVTLGPDQVRVLCRLLHGQGPEE